MPNSRKIPAAFRQTSRQAVLLPCDWTVELGSLEKETLRELSSWQAYMFKEPPYGYAVRTAVKDGIKFPDGNSGAVFLCFLALLNGTNQPIPEDFEENMRSIAKTYAIGGATRLAMRDGGIGWGQVVDAPYYMRRELEQMLQQ